MASRAQQTTHSRAHKSYAKRISDHVAVALVVYTLALIFITSPAMSSEGTSILPYFMLVVFVAMVIPACRNMERRWQALEKGELNEAGLEGRFNTDRFKLWVAALGIPVLLYVLFTVF
jgi:cell division protein FtsW (lipid II flippase)